MAILNLGNSNSAFSGSFSGSFEGNGSGLTGIDTGSAFPFTGDAEITGSLIVSGSNTSGLEVRGPIQVRHSGSPAARFSANSDTSEEVLLYDSKITIEDSGYEMVKLSGNLYSQRVGVLELRRWTTNEGAVIIAHPSYTSYIQSSLLIGKTGTVTNTHPYKLDVNGDIKLGNGTDDSIEILGPVTASTDISSSATSTASFGHYIGDGSQLTGVISSSYALTASHAISASYAPAGATPTLQEVTTAGSTTTNGITVGELTSSGDILLPTNAATINFTNGAGIRGRFNGSYPGMQFYSGNTSTSKIWFWKGTAGSLSAPTASFNGGLVENVKTLKSSANIPLIIQGGNPSNGANDGIRFQTADASNAFQTRFEIESDGATSDAYFTNITGLGINKTSGFVAELDVSGDINASGDITASKFLGDGSALTNLPPASAGSTSGRVVFTTTNGELTTDSGFDYNSTEDRLTVSNLTTTTFTASFITSSTIETSGSNIFGDEAGVDTQTLIGTTKITGSAEVDGNTQITGSLIISGSGGAKFIVDNVVDIETGVFYGLGRGVPALNNGNHTNILVGNDIAGKGDYGSVVIGTSAGASNSHHSQVVIGRNANSVSSYAVAVGNSSEVNDFYGISIGHNAGNDSNTKGINIGGNAQGKGEKGIVISSIGDTIISPTKANTFGIYMTDASPNFEIEATGSSTLSGSSFTIEKSGSTVFEVIGSEGTLFSIDDDLDGTIFTANDRSGLPVLEASASGEVYIGKAPQSLYTTAVISSTTAATTQSIFGLSTSSYGGAFFDYTVQSGSDARAGSIMSVWNGSNISFTETTTTDIGDTTDFNVIVHISQSQAQIASHATRAGYNIKTIIRSI